MLRYHNIIHDDMLNGDGLRVTLFLSGCTHHCKNCQNPETLDRQGGIPFDSNAVAEIGEQLEQPHISGLTLSGGDPLCLSNRVEVTKLCRIVKSIFPDKTIWLYTGYNYQDIKYLPIMDYIDVVVDGPFIQELADENFEWAGSTNQRIIRRTNV